MQFLYRDRCLVMSHHCKNPLRSIASVFFCEKKNLFMDELMIKLCLIDYLTLGSYQDISQYYDADNLALKQSLAELNQNRHLKIGGDKH